MTGHSPEPWRYSPGKEDADGKPLTPAVILSGECTRIADVLGGVQCSTTHARRIIATVNFCQHLPTEIIEQLTEAGIGPATLAQWIRKNPTFEGEGYSECIECLTDCTEPHEENCLLDKFLDILKGWGK